jgi:molybdenum-dependent DNA-binding transcriptional regulator ModE
VTASIPDPSTRRRPDFDLDAPDDAAFSARAPQIEAYLLANFAGLRGLQQHRPHFDPARERTTDPIEHTLEVLAALDTRGLDQQDVRILRAATIFHDIGKLLNPLNVRHAIDSAAICPPYLPDFGLDPDACDDVVAIVRDHDVLGRVCQGRLTVDEAMDIFGTSRRAELTGRLTRADVGSIRGLARVVSSIEGAYAAVLALFTARQYSQRYTPPQPTAGVAAILGRLAPRARIWIEIDGAIGLSQWHVALLEAVEATGSLAQAAEKLETPIGTARRRLREVEGHLGLRLLARQRGVESSPLTPEARELLARWRFFSAGLNEWVESRFGKTFTPPSA